MKKNEPGKEVEAIAVASDECMRLVQLIATVQYSSVLLFCRQSRCKSEPVASKQDTQIV